MEHTYSRQQELHKAQKVMYVSTPTSAAGAQTAFVRRSSIPTLTATTTCKAEKRQRLKTAFTFTTERKFTSNKKGSSRKDRLLIFYD